MTAIDNDQMVRNLKKKRFATPGTNTHFLCDNLSFNYQAHNTSSESPTLAVPSIMKICHQYCITIIILCRQNRKTISHLVYLLISLHTQGVDKGWPAVSCCHLETSIMEMSGQWGLGSNYEPPAGRQTEVNFVAALLSISPVTICPVI